MWTDKGYFARALLVDFTKDLPQLTCCLSLLVNINSVVYLAPNVRERPRCSKIHKNIFY